MTITFCLIFTVIVVYFLISPHLLPSDTFAGAGNREESALLQQKNRCMQVLKDLELDYSTEKISKDDYERTKRALETELGTLLTKLNAAR